MFHSGSTNWNSILGTSVVLVTSVKRTPWCGMAVCMRTFMTQTLLVFLLICDSAFEIEAMNYAQLSWLGTAKELHLKEWPRTVQSAGAEWESLTNYLQCYQPCLWPWRTLRGISCATTAIGQKPTVGEHMWPSACLELGLLIRAAGGPCSSAQMTALGGSSSSSYEIVSFMNWAPFLSRHHRDKASEENVIRLFNIRTMTIPVCLTAI